jgi:hypothetical protein
MAGKTDTIDLTDKSTPERASMNTVIVDKVKLLETLSKNREEHRAVFLEAMAGYKAKVLQLLDEHTERVKNNGIEQVNIHLPMPSDHTEDYDRAIATLKWTLLDEVELTIQEFDMYVRDSWGWKREWTTSNSVYAASLQQ